MARPLKGKRLLVTRDSKGNAGFRTKLEALGAEVIAFDSITFGPPTDLDALDRSLESLGGFDDLVFTSSNGVRAVAARLNDLSIDRNVVIDRRIACIGKTTAAACEGEFRSPDLVPAGGTGEALARAIIESTGSLYERRIVLLRAEVGNPDLPILLASEGAVVKDVAAYRLRNNPSAAVLLSEPIGATRAPDAILFASGSAARSTITALRADGPADWLRSAQLLCLGPTALEACQEFGLLQARSSAEPNLDSLIELTVNVLLQNPVRTVRTRPNGGFGA